MKINLEIKFESGAKVILTKEEVEKVTNFINKMLLEPQIKQTRRTRQIYNQNPWKNQDLLKINQILSLPEDDQRKAYKQLSVEIGRTYGAVRSQAYRIKRKQNQLQQNNLPNFAERLMAKM